MAYELEFPELSQKGVLETAQSNAGMLWQKLMQISSSDLDKGKEFADELFCQLHSLRRELGLCKDQDEILHANLSKVLRNLFCMLAFMRDIHDGLGFRRLTYLCILSFYRCFPIVGEAAVKHVLFDSRIGCWRDGPGLCEVLPSRDHPLVTLVVRSMNEALEKNEGTVAKWIPRETSRKQKWLFEELAVHWCCKHDHYYPSSSSARKKCFMKYRKKVAALSSCYAEQKLCGHQKLQVDGDITQTNLAKYWNCFFAQTTGLFSTKVSPERHLFALSLVHSLKKLPCVGEKHICGGDATLSFPANMKTYVGLARKSMLLLDDTPPNIGREVEALNHLMGRLFENWRKRVDVAEWALPVIDVNVYSLEDPILYRAIGHAYFVARKSGVNRILFCAHQPMWIHLDAECDEFFHGMRAIFKRLEGEIILNTGAMKQSLGLLGSAHPFCLYVISQNGSCFPFGKQFHYRSLENHIQHFREKYGSLFDLNWLSRESSFA